MDEGRATERITAAITLPAGSVPTLSLPLGYDVGAQPRPSLAAIIHLYYDELAPELRDVLTLSMAGPADLYVTTDTDAKRAALADCFADWPHGKVEVRLVPNRGRDVAPRIVGLADVHERYELCLNLHGKRSPHWIHGDAWRRDQVGLLAGNREVVLGILEAFRRWPRLGLVMPRIFPPVRPSINWGYDFDRCVRLGERLGIAITRSQALHFPAGSMFWSRRGALRPLLDLALSPEDFEEEDGLPRGSMAHAIERLMLHICERAGFHWLAVGRDEVPALDRRVEVRSPQELDAVIAAGFLRLTDPDLNPPDTNGPADLLRARFQPDRQAPARLTLLLDHQCMEAGTGPGSPLRHMIDTFAGERGFTRRRVVLPGRAEASAVLHHLLPPDTEMVALSRDGLATPLSLGPNDLLLAPEGRAGELGERLLAAGRAFGTAFRLCIVPATGKAIAPR